MTIFTPHSPWPPEWGQESRVLGPGYGPHGASDSSRGTSSRACVHCLVRNCTSLSIDKKAHKTFWPTQCTGHGGRGTAWHEQIYCWRRRRLWWLKGPHQALGPGTISRRRMELKSHLSFCAPVESWHTEKGFLKSCLGAQLPGTKVINYHKAFPKDANRCA